MVHGRLQRDAAADQTGKIICYNTPFPEMQGDVVFVDYDRSSWRYMNYERSYKAEGLDAFKVGGQPQAFYDTISPFIDVPLKGGGSAYGGQWRPNPSKPNDAIYWGPANTIQRVFISTRKGGYWATVKYDSIGRAVLIRHETVHVPNGIHSNPHDHIIRFLDLTPVRQLTILMEIFQKSNDMNRGDYAL